MAIESGRDVSILDHQFKDMEVSESSGIEFVVIPCDSNEPMRMMNLPSLQGDDDGVGDRIPAFVKPYFADGRTVDVGLVQEQAQRTIATSPTQIQKLDTKDNITAASLNAVAAQGSVEIFPLVRPAGTNGHHGVYLYVDELGMLKKLPVNSRAAAMARECGLPPQKFHGDVFVGRVRTKPTVQNVDFRLHRDTDRDTAVWMQRAPHENREWHETAKTVSESRKKTTPTDDDDDDGSPKDDEIAMTWEQNEDELEIRIPFPNVDVIDKDKVTVAFLPKSIDIQYDNVDIVSMKPLYNAIQAGDGSCTWTIEKPNTLVVTVEVSDPTVAWPRLTLT